MLLINHHQLQAAANSLGMRRSDIARTFNYSWEQVDRWWTGKGRIPYPIALIITTWMHPLFPVALRPRRGIPYVLELPIAAEKYFARILPRA